jgi:hypothetical protein
VVDDAPRVVRALFFAAAAFFADAMTFSAALMVRGHYASVEWNRRQLFFPHD